MMKPVYIYILAFTFLLIFSKTCNAQQSIIGSAKHQEIIQENQVALSPPIMDVSSYFFKDTAVITSRNSNKSIQTFYSLKEMGSDFRGVASSPLYLTESGRYLFKNMSNPLSINQTDGAQESEVVAISVLKLPKPIIESISLSEPANTTYPGDGATTLTDLIKGTNDFRDGNWLGYSTEVLTLDVNLEKKKKISKVTISTLRNQGAWIFVPKEIEILINGKLVSSKVTDSESDAMNELLFLENSFDSKCTKTVQIRIKSLSKLPDWHPGKGALPWFFIDEIIIE